MGEGVQHYNSLFFLSVSAVQLSFLWVLAFLWRVHELAMFSYENRFYVEAGDELTLIPLKLYNSVCYWQSVHEQLVVHV